MGNLPISISPLMLNGIHRRLSKICLNDISSMKDFFCFNKTVSSYLYMYYNRPTVVLNCLFKNIWCIMNTYIIKKFRTGYRGQPADIWDNPFNSSFNVVSIKSAAGSRRANLAWNVPVIPHASWWAVKVITEYVQMYICINIFIYMKIT